MSRFSGAQVKGAMREVREQKRLEAEERNSKTPESRRRSARLQAEAAQAVQYQIKATRRRVRRREATS